MKFKIEDIRSIGILANADGGWTLTPVFNWIGNGQPIKVKVTADEFAAISCNDDKYKEKACEMLNSRPFFYNEKLSADRQITIEEGIAAIIYDGQETLGSELDENCTLHEEDCQVLSKSILLYVLKEFRMDLMTV